MSRFTHDKELTTKRFTPDVDFRTLSIRYLLEARDADHRHLVRLRNVVGTAIGYYLFDQDDPGARGKDRPTGRSVTSISKPYGVSANRGLRRTTSPNSTMPSRARPITIAEAPFRFASGRYTMR